MDVALGLDISTAVIGWSIVQAVQLVQSSTYTKPLSMGHIDLTKVKSGFWGKVDHAEQSINSIVYNIQKQHKITVVYVEDPLKKFRKGSSSAHTISLLLKFNAIISNITRKSLNIEPLYIDATAARKSIGVVLQSKKNANGKDQKQQTFEHLCNTVFINHDWPRNRNGTIYGWCLDEVDAYVICLAGCIGLGEPA